MNLLVLLLACTATTDPSPADGGAGDGGAGDGGSGDGGAAIAAHDCEPAWAALTAGVSTIEQGGSLPSRLIVHGDQACPIVLDEADRTFIASTVYGSGRAVHTGHEAIISDPVSLGGDDARFVLNALSWLSGKDRPRVGVESGLSTLQSWLEDEGYEVSVVGVGELSSVDVFVATSYTERSDEEYEAVRTFVEGGGGLLQGGHAWWWAYENPDVALDYMGNKILNPMGITITEETVDAGTDLIPATAPTELVHAGKALDAIEAHLAGSSPLDDDQQTLAAATVGDAVRLLPLSFDEYFDRVRSMLASIEPVVPTIDEPIRPSRQPIEALVATVETRFALDAEPDEVLAVVTDFPGPVPADSPRITRSLDLTASYAGMDSAFEYANAGEPLWLGTGIYAPPGEVMTATIPSAWAGQGLSLRVGAHTDALWSLDEWARHPELSRVVELEASETRFASGFGGPVYLRVPAGTDLGTGELTLAGGVAYARYQHGTDLSEFQAQLSQAPIAEFEGEHFILTVPAAEVPAGTDPAALINVYDRVLDADAELLSLSERVRPERFAVDVQISAGWMHSGYPLMGYQYTSHLADSTAMSTEGDWGAFHELGHNHQFGPLNLPGTTECTVNLWSVYAFEQVLGIDRGVAHESLAPATREAAITSYIAGGRDFEGDWNVWTCLETWLQLQEAFGWGFYQGLHARYLAMPTGSRPSTDAAKVDALLVQGSEQAGQDLSGFFEAWGLPISASAKDSVAHLPDWEDHPLAGR